MAILVTACPHCCAEKIALKVAGQAYNGSQFGSNFYLCCPNCDKPSSVEMIFPGAEEQGVIPPWDSHRDLVAAGWKIVQMWPDPPRPRVPDHLPKQVERAYLAAERNFHLEAMEEASAGSYGRALDLATKIMAPEYAGTLFERIKHLAAEHRMTPDLAEWAHHIRLVRNDAMHDLGQVSREELTALRGFAEMVMTYLFTLPGMLAERKAKSAGP